MRFSWSSESFKRRATCAAHRWEELLQFELEADRCAVVQADSISVRVAGNLPSGVAASEIPPQLSNVRPLAKGEPAPRVSAPLAGLMLKTLNRLVAAVGDKQKVTRSTDGDPIEPVTTGG